MNAVKKIIASAMLALSTLGLTISLPAFADGASDATVYCSTCHNGLTVAGGVVVGGGARACPQRTVSEWTTTIERMNAKGCGVPAGSIAGIANYLAGLGSTTSSSTPSSTSTSSTTTSTSTSSSSTTSSTTTTTVFRCAPYYFWINPSSLSFTVTQGGVLPASQSLSVSFNNALQTPQWSITSASAWLSVTPTTGSGSSGVTVSIPSTQLEAGVYAGFISFVSYLPNCPVPTLASATVTLTVEPSTSSSTSTTTTSTTTTTVATTTTTTLCNTYANGTTQYKYSGSGSCHSFYNDDVTGLHIVRDQSYCKKHMSHFNSKGNHVHAYPHPICM